MTIDKVEWEEILFFARKHDWFDEGDEIEWNIFNNNASRDSLILSPNVNGTVRGDILAKISVTPKKYSEDKLNLYWESGFKANTSDMELFDNVVKWKADFTADWIKNKLLEKAHIYYEKYYRGYSSGGKSLRKNLYIVILQEDNGWEVLTLAIIKNGQFHKQVTKPFVGNSKKCGLLCLHKGVFLLTRSNTRNLVGQVYIVHKDLNSVFFELYIGLP